MPEITRLEFDPIAKHINDLTGISIDWDKHYFLEARLAGLLEEENCVCFGDLFQKLKHGNDDRLDRKLIDAISTRETYFFRNQSPFALLQQKILPDLIDRRSPSLAELKKLPLPIRIWSAGCSTGQEIYSICIVLKELLNQFENYRIKILGTDISDAAIAKASSGIFSRQEIERGLDPDMLARHFTTYDNQWKINDELRSLVVFKRINLSRSFEELGKFDIIFCRNVAIYFSRSDRQHFFSRIAAAMEPDGYLILGSTETLRETCDRFIPQTHLNCTYYRLKDDLLTPGSFPPK
ncbi:MAG: protein-glutamate O-methyltransferase CheR [Proteobacteria bacterium]|nr:protein-glutamate O-methyltransferase CheR [Pseudomonadota bacterium]MBU1688265.1 protein-glutamate O-methyltransferase CheR [Pseudomonadota bacterium]